MLDENERIKFIVTLLIAVGLQLSYVTLSITIFSLMLYKIYSCLIFSILSIIGKIKLMIKFIILF